MAQGSLPVPTSSVGTILPLVLVFPLTLLMGTAPRFTSLWLEIDKLMGVGQGGEGRPPGLRERRRLCQEGQGCAWWGLGRQPQGIIAALSWGAASLAHPSALGQGALPFPVTGQVAMAASWEAQPPRILRGDWNPGHHMPQACSGNFLSLVPFRAGAASWFPALTAASKSLYRPWASVFLLVKKKIGLLGE